MYYVYVLKSLEDGKLYIGSSADPEQRLAAHNLGKTASTKSRRPFVLIHKEEFTTRELAEKREGFLKTGRGHEVLYNILLKDRPSTKALEGSPPPGLIPGEGDPPML